MIVSDGDGKWVHGPNATPFAEEIVVETIEESASRQGQGSFDETEKPYSNLVADEATPE